MDAACSFLRRLGPDPHAGGPTPAAQGCPDVWELSTGEVGYGMHENVCAGVYHPYGFHSFDAVAP